MVPNPGASQGDPTVMRVFDRYLVGTGRARRLIRHESRPSEPP